ERAQVPFNPASVVKVGTTWFALERLGPEHRYVTRFGFTGSWDRATGTITGDLVVGGGGDPDFQPENAFLVARELDRLGVRRVSGNLVIDGPFWLGWEGGPFRRAADPAERARRAGRRLLRALNPFHWGIAQREAWEKLCTRRGWPVRPEPSVVVAGTVRVADVEHVRPLLVHRSNPLAVILKRFDVYSNNDIERIADGLGGAPAVEAFLRSKVGPGVRLETACGLGTNRMTAVQVVHMLEGLARWLAGHGLALRDILPVPGCDPGPIPRMFPALATGDLARAVAVKSGTLSDTDGGVAVLAGAFTDTSGAEVFFCVAAPRAGGRLHQLRGLEQDWLTGLIGRRGGARVFECGARLLFSDTGAGLVEVEKGGKR
ncbi:MAG TPA: hypothetical protein ENK19_08745, partial [Acidobacteria bacterium]|nr:hypothetical protein [Acidobacteriota bacterium]